jgi:uncharacterized protein YciU (UPF0263 family)
VIDGGNGDWPQAVTHALPGYRQGTLVTRPPLFYQANTELPVWVASRQAVDKSADILVELDPDDRAPFGIITSQSCDVDEEGGNRKPWVQVAPVYELAQAEARLPLVRLWKVYYFVPVPTLGDRWVGDLRIEVPIEKGWLVSNAHQDAYVDQLDFDRLSDHIMAYRGRRAMATSVYNLVLKPLQAFVQGLAKDAPELHHIIQQSVSELFVEVAGDHLKPAAVGLVLISDSPWPVEVVDAFDGWWVREVADITDPFVTTANRFLLSSAATLKEFRRWIPVDWSRIGSS